MNDFIKILNQNEGIFNNELTFDADLSPIQKTIVSEHIPALSNNTDLSYQQQIKLGMKNDLLMKQTSFHYKFGLDIVTETCFEYPYPFITEKTLKNILSKRPFIILGPAGILDILKQKGFKTFSKIVNEEYDNEKNHKQRFEMVCSSIKSFTTQPIEKVRQDVESISDVLEHNFQHMQKIEDIELSQIRL